MASPLRRRAAVLLYHRVATPATDPWDLAVSPANFAEQMEVLRQSRTVVPIEELPALLARRGAPRQCVAVTFDDGYADNLHAAVPVLERFDLPVTVFVAAGAVDGPGFWWDRLEQLLLRPVSLPERLDLILSGRRHTWTLGAWATCPPATLACHDGWRASAPPPTPRHAMFLDLWQRLQSLTTAEREAAWNAVTLWAKSEFASDAPVLSTADLAALARHPLVAIGGHTVSHPRLSALSPAEQRVEVAEGRRRLETITGRPLHTFAYPFGRPADYTADTVRIVREAGFVGAYVNQSGTAGPRTDPYRIPRAYVRNVDGNVFERQLAGWLTAPAR